jgi:peptidoglycan hydrolase-like protein with peptidoglycan-binding domain
MRFTRYIWLVAVLGLWLTGPADLAGAAAKKKAATATTKKTATATTKKTVATKAKSKQSAKTSKSRSKAKAYRATQQKPAPERYVQVQEALAARGYASGDSNGIWNDGWISSLKQFQKDQKLNPDGKINSLSLIALGLGPQRTGSLVRPSPETPAASLTEP